MHSRGSGSFGGYGCMRLAAPTAVRACICSGRFEARRYACSVQTIIGYFSRRDGAGYSAAAHAAAASHACVRGRAARPACDRRAAVAPPARPAQATSTTSTCTIRPPGPGRTSLQPSAAPRRRLDTVTASHRRGASSTCTGAMVKAVREGRGGRRAWGWRGPSRGGATCCHETGGATGWRAWGRVAGETAGGRMRGLRACVRACVHGLVRGWCGEAGTRGGLVAAALPVSGRGAGWRGPRRRA
jgi:hypothetical protein